MAKPHEQDVQLKRSISEGNAAALMQGLGTDFVSAFALRLGASADQIGLLAALPQLVHALTQFLALHLVSKVRSRLGLIRAVVLLQALLWLPVAALALWSGPSSFWALVILYVVITGASALINPFWTSWLSEWVPVDRRGAFFSLRNKVNGFTEVAATFLAGLVLSAFDSTGYAAMGFAVLFCAAAVGRLASYSFFARSKERVLHVCRDLYAGNAWTHARSEAGFWILVRYSALFSFAVAVASPFFVIYLLHTQGFSYAEYALTVTAGALASFLSMAYWGRLADRYSNKLVLTYVTLVIPLIPIVYMAPVHQIAYFILIELVSGTLWAGQKLASFNLLIENTPVSQRARFVSYSNIANGLGTFAGALLGGALAAYFLTSGFSTAGISGFPLLFLISAILRVVVTAFGLPYLRGKVVRQVKRQRQFFFKAVTVLPFRSMSFVLQHDAVGTAGMIGKGIRKLGRREDRWLHRVEVHELHDVRHAVHTFRKHHHRLARMLFKKRRH